MCFKSLIRTNNKRTGLVLDIRLKTMKKKNSVKRDTRIKDSFLYGVVNRYFDDEAHWKSMTSVLKNSQRGGVSLRLLDFLCTDFAYMEPCMVRTADSTMAPLLDVYEASLNAYGKSRYDCFRRTARVVMEKHGGRISTTLGQLLFFKDIIQNGVLEFAHENVDRIKAAMGATNLKFNKKRRALVPKLIPFPEQVLLFSSC